ncbi:hypothetical protein GY21_17920 [Cryobacterium roopkundense]|uniref:Uncharacterized protein n=1 Tax=Cryobacterium roopkundense TaxID=1001240 RepID=A0A099J1L8_9MICO|nr:hypothetical protein [Cryobacterium roopkundense]KGJ72050.1 hypothetical protein GY21_17920 [Cryobacterium roopkundense]MBB5640664.1 hypothetical protein [Cryobacterium roopkundense]
MSDSPIWPVRPTAAIHRGQWVIDALGSWATIAGLLPARYEAYARIFHPSDGQYLLWTGDQARSENTHVVRWAEAAEREGTVMHPLAQWGSLTDGYRQPAFGEDGWQYGEPAWGRMDLPELAAVARVLARHTATADTCLATLWAGFGEINGSAVRLTRGDEGGFESSIERHAAILEAWANPRLEVPQRKSLLFELDVRVLADLGWAWASGWADEYGVSVLTPQLLWPEGREWFLASEIDFNSTVVGGSPALIAELLALGATGVIEVLELPDGADLTSGGDAINQRPNGSEA